MTAQQIVARHGVHPPERRRIWRVLLFVSMLPIILPASCIAYIEFVPAYSASFAVTQIDATVSLSFYWLWDERANNSGRYVTVRSRKGTVTQKICGFDWAHWPRTSIYLTPEQNIAVLGTDSCDYLFLPREPRVERAWKMASDKWTYLGAFDLGGGHANRALRFIPATTQAECIEMMGVEPLYDWMVRRDARRARCR